MVSLLDQFDGDENQEDDGSGEPSLGAPEKHASNPYCPYPGGAQVHWADGLRDDHEREVDILDEPHDGGEDDEEDYLGSPCV